MNKSRGLIILGLIVGAGIGTAMGHPAYGIALGTAVGLILSRRRK